MQHHIKTEIRHHQPEILALSARPDAGNEQQHDDRLYNIIDGISVFHEHRAMAQFILQHIILMQLDRFAHQIFYDRLCTGACGIRPVHEFTFHNRGALLRTPFLFSFLLSQLLCLLDAVVLGFLGYLLSSDDLQASLDRVVCQRITGMLDLRHALLSGFLFCRFLGFQFLTCHLVRPYEDAVFPSAETPQ